MYSNEQAFFFWHTMYIVLFVSYTCTFCFPLKKFSITNVAQKVISRASHEHRKESYMNWCFPRNYTR